MKLSRRLAVSLLVSIAGTALFLALKTQGEAEAKPARSPQATFTVSSDPTEVILSVVDRPGRRRTQRVLEAFGDGRIVLRVEEIRTQEVVEEYSITVTFDELVELVNIAISNGLVEATAEQIEKQKNEDARFYSVKDGGSTAIAVRLDTYTLGQSTRENVENRLTFYAAGYYAELQPEIQELQGIVALRTRQRAYFEQARGKNQ